MEDECLVPDHGRAIVRDVLVLIVERAVDGETEIHECRCVRDEVGHDEVHVDRCAGELRVEGMVRIPGVVGRVVPGAVEGLRDVDDLVREHGAVYAEQALEPVGTRAGARAVHGQHARDAISLLVIYSAVDGDCGYDRECTQRRQERHQQNSSPARDSRWPEHNGRDVVRVVADERR